MNYHADILDETLDENRGQPSQIEHELEDDIPQFIYEADINDIPRSINPMVSIPLDQNINIVDNNPAPARTKLQVTLSNLKTNTMKCCSATTDFIFHHKFLTFILIQIFIIVLRIMKAIPQNVESMLSVCAFIVLILLSIVHCILIIRRENENLRRFSYLYQGTDNEVPHRLRNPEILLASSQNADARQVNQIRVHQLRYQLRHLNQIIAEMNNQMRNNRMYMAVQYMSRNRNGQPVVLPPDVEMGYLGQILLSQNFLNFLSDLTTNVENPQNQNHGLSEEQINSFPLSLFKSSQEHIDNPDTCTICLEDFKEGIEVRSMPCNHIFHKNCIDEWLHLRNSCPNCKREFQGQQNSNGSNNSQENVTE